MLTMLLKLLKGRRILFVELARGDEEAILTLSEHLLVATMLGLAPMVSHPNPNHRKSSPNISGFMEGRI